MNQWPHSPNSSGKFYVDNLGAWWTVLSFDHNVMGIILLDLQSKDFPKAHDADWGLWCLSCLPREPLCQNYLAMPIWRQRFQNLCLDQHRVSPGLMNNSWMDRIWGVNNMFSAAPWLKVFCLDCAIADPYDPYRLVCFYPCSSAGVAPMVFSKEDLRTCQLLKT